MILLSVQEVDGRPLRTIDILKMRGSRLEKTKCVFTLERGFEVFETIRSDLSRDSTPIEGIADSPNRYSTGLAELDKILSGGYSKGDIVLVEVDQNVSAMEYSIALLPYPGRNPRKLPGFGSGTTRAKGLPRFKS